MDSSGFFCHVWYCCRHCWPRRRGRPCRAGRRHQAYRKRRPQVRRRSGLNAFLPAFSIRKAKARSMCRAPIRRAIAPTVPRSSNAARACIRTATAGKSHPAAGLKRTEADCSRKLSFRFALKPEPAGSGFFMGSISWDRYHGIDITGVAASLPVCGVRSAILSCR